MLTALFCGGLVATGASNAIAAEVAGGRHPRFGMGQGQGQGQWAEMRAARQERRAAMRASRALEAPMQRMPEPDLPRRFVPMQVPGGDFDRGVRPGRLTPDERRALRQQIDEAGRDVYRPNGRR